MTLEEKIENDFRQALKNRETATIATLRLLKSALKNEKISQKKELSDDGVIKIIRSEVKKRREAALEYKKGGRDDLASKEEQELEILKKYLPRELDEAEIEKIVQNVISKLGAATAGDFGRVMGAAMKEIGGRASGDVAGKIVKEKLGSQ